MKILVVHNAYRIPGGEQVVAHNEIEMLRANGHDVIIYTRSNDELAGLSALEKGRMPVRMIWSRQATADLTAIIRTHAPDVAHIHNTHFMISPAAIHACAGAGVPVVQTLHNFRLICPAATLFRDGAVCELCVGKPIQYPGVRYGCFRGSRTQTAALAVSNAFHNVRGTWDRVAQFITPTRFVRQKLMAGGLPADQIVVKPHFLPQDPGTGPAMRDRYLLYVGRFTTEKGSDVLLDAWETLPNIPLKVVGDGPLLPAAQARLGASFPPHQIELLGRIPRAQVSRLMRHAYALVVSSACYETFGMVAIEAFAAGTPVIASGHGAPAELIAHGETGLHFTPGDPASLATAVRTLTAQPERAAKMGLAARHTYEQHYTAPHNYDQLMAIYDRVLA